MIYSNIPMRDAFLNSLYEFAKLDENIILTSNDFGAPALTNLGTNYRGNLLMREFLNKTSLAWLPV